jgi:hypothetical protein
MMRAGLTFALTAMLLQAVGAQAATLDKDTCSRLEVEQTALEKGGARATLAKGAAWAKDNLPLDKLQEVRRLIEVDEQILFRCQGKPLVLLPSSVDADPVQSTDDPPDGEKPADDAAATPKAAPAKDAKTPAPKAAAVTPGKAGTEAPAKKAPPAAPKTTVPVQPKPKDSAVKTETTTAAAKPKPAPKKVDDAYKPPKPEPGQEPFSLQNTNRSQP